MSNLYQIFHMLTTFTIIALAADYIKEKPNWVSSCRINDPDFTECTTKTIQGMLNQMSNEGIPGLKSFPVIEPYKLNKIKISQGGDGPVSIKIKLSDISIIGFGKAIVNESRFRTKDYGWDTKLFLPNLKFNGNYAVQGRVLVLPLNGHGKIDLDIDNMDIKIITKTILYEKADLIFNNVTDTIVDYAIKGLKVKMDNLFNGNKELEESANTLFNENWEPLADTLKPVIKETIQEILLDIFQRLFHFLPAHYFVADIPDLYG